MNMKIAALFLIAFAIVLLSNAPVARASIRNSVRASSSSGNGDNSSVNVNIKNNVNTGTNTLRLPRKQILKLISAKPAKEHLQ